MTKIKTFRHITGDISGLFPLQTQHLRLSGSSNQFQCSQQTSVDLWAVFTWKIHYQEFTSHLFHEKQFTQKNTNMPKGKDKTLQFYMDSLCLLINVKIIHLVTKQMNLADILSKISKAYNNTHSYTHTNSYVETTKVDIINQLKRENFECFHPKENI